MTSVIGDIRDFQKLKTVFNAAQPEIVLHLAAQPIVRDSYKDPRYTYETKEVDYEQFLKKRKLVFDMVATYNDIPTKIAGILGLQW